MSRTPRQIGIYLFLATLGTWIPIAQSQEHASTVISTQSVTNQLLYVTLRIEAIHSNQKTVEYGTGFLYSFDFTQTKGIIGLVTNKHVTDGADIARITFHKRRKDVDAPSGELHTYTIEGLQQACIPHPDPSIDLVVIPLNAILADAQEAGNALFIRTLDRSLIPSASQLEGLLAVEEILMVGYPIGLSDRKHNYPIIRKGITASHPAVDFDGKPMFLIDVACFPGSSGSPVLIVNQGSYATSDGGLSIGQRIHLIGILFAGPTFTSEGTIVQHHIPTTTNMQAQFKQMIHLGMAIPTRELAVLHDHLRAQFSSDSR